MLSREKRAEYFGMGGLFAVTIVWGLGFVFSNMALLAHLSASSVIFARFFIAALLVGVFFHRTIRKNFKKSQLKGALLTGAALFLGFFIQMLGLERSTPSNNAFITAAYVVMVPFIWWAITKKRPPILVFFSSALSLTGVAVLSLQLGGGNRFTVNGGDFITLLSAFFFALQIVLTGIFAASVHYIVLVFIQFCLAAALGLAAFLILDGGKIQFFSSQGLISILFLGAASTFFCCIVQTKAQKYVSSAKTSVIMSLESLFGAIFSVIAGYDSMTVKMITGGALIFTAVILSEIPILRFGRLKMVDRK